MLITVLLMDLSFWNTLLQCMRLNSMPILYTANIWPMSFPWSLSDHLYNFQPCSDIPLVLHVWFWYVKLVLFLWKKLMMRTGVYSTFVNNKDVVIHSNHFFCLHIKPDMPINVYTRFCLNTAKSKFSLVSPVADWWKTINKQLNWMIY